MSQTIAKPAPIPDETSAPFFDGARASMLMVTAQPPLISGPQSISHLEILI